MKEEVNNCIFMHEVLAFAPGWRSRLEKVCSQEVKVMR